MHSQYVVVILAPMPPSLSPGEKSVTIQVKLPPSLKKIAVRMAQEDGDGDLSGWIRNLIRAAAKAKETPKAKGK